MDEAAWGALALALTLLGGIYTFFAYQRRGLAAGLRGGAIALLPIAAWLTGVLELLTDIAGAIGDWAIDLAFSPSMWFGTALAGLAVVLFVVSGFVANRSAAQKPVAKSSKSDDAKRLPAAKPQKSAPVVDPVDAEMAEIEAILRKRGIT